MEVDLSPASSWRDVKGSETVSFEPSLSVAVARMVRLLIPLRFCVLLPLCFNITGEPFSRERLK
jgi:hypothetical protein